MNGKFLSAWLKDIGVTRVTGYRWIQKGRITVETYYGRKFIPQTEIDRFFREGKNECVAK